MNSVDRVWITSYFELCRTATFFGFYVVGKDDDLLMCKQLGTDKLVFAVRNLSSAIAEANDFFSRLQQDEQFNGTWFPLPSEETKGDANV